MNKFHKKIIFISLNTISPTGFSGGDTIYFSFIKHWHDKLNISVLGSEETAVHLRKQDLSDKVKILTAAPMHKPLPQEKINSLGHIFYNTALRAYKGILYVIKNKKGLAEYNYVYSVSDFYPDFFPAFLIKLFNKKTVWLAGYYLFAPAPWDKDSPYKGKNFIKGLLYWLMQIPSYLLVKYFADYVLVTSEPDVKRFTTKKRGSEKIVVVQGGIDTGYVKDYLSKNKLKEVGSRKYDACFLGRFHYQKGVLELIDIWNLVQQKKKDAQLVMIGDGELMPEVKDKVIKTGLSDNIDLVGFKSGIELYEFFKESKIVIHPATYDSGGMASAEAMAWGLPGVSFDLESLKTYYPQGMLKVPLNDFNKMAQTIIELLSNKELYNKTALEAQELAFEVWDWEKRAHKIFAQIFGYKNEN